MKSWTLAGAFEAGHIRGLTPDGARELDFHQLEVTGHGDRLEEDYRLFREEFGLRSFRDGAWLARTYPRPHEFDWTYLDRLASISAGQVTLTLCHYEWLPWIEEADIWNGRVIDLMAEYAGRVAQRYRGCFAGYIPVVESGYWTAMMTDWGRWWPARGSESAPTWWELYSVVGRMLVAMARAVREADPDARIALSEPWNWRPDLSLEDQRRPFNLSLGRPDPVAQRETGSDDWGGAADLLQVVGLNVYSNHGEENGWPLSRLLMEARRRFPEQRVVLGETGNCHCPDCFSVPEWLELLDREVETANAQGAAVTTVTWAPLLTLRDFDWGHQAPGALVSWDPTDPGRRRRWDRTVARAVHAYTAAPRRRTAGKSARRSLRASHLRRRQGTSRREIGQQAR